jgi:hypothetical protein
MNLEGKVAVTSIAEGEGGLSLRGGWHWQEPESLTEEDRADLKGLLASQKGFNSEIAAVFAVRTQTVRGRNQHVIFRDSDGALNSAVVSTDLDQSRSVSSFERITG